MSSEPRKKSESQHQESRRDFLKQGSLAAAIVALGASFPLKASAQLLNGGALWRKRKVIGGLWAWGDNATKSLGIGSTPSSTGTPTQVGTFNKWIDVSGSNVHTLAIQNDGSLWAWGDNTGGELGIGSFTGQYSTPQAVGADRNWIQVSTSNDKSSMALKADGTLWAVGYNGSGQLGVGDANPRSTLTRVSGTEVWKAVCCSLSSTLALHRNGSLWVWGDGTYGQLGNGTTNTWRSTPSQMGTDTSWKQISGGYFSFYAIKSDGTLWTWGLNDHGELGIGSTSLSSTPVQIVSSIRWLQVSAGDGYVLAIKVDGSLWAWGANFHYQIGNGSNVDVKTPVRIGTSTDWVHVNAASACSHAIQKDGSLWAWGDSVAGNLGLASTVTATTPTRVGVLNTWTKLGTGMHTFALRSK